MIYTLYTGWQTIFMYNFSVYICTQNTFLKSASRDVQNAQFWRNAKCEYLIFVLPYLRVLGEKKDGSTHLLFSSVFLLLGMEGKRKKERKAGGWEGENR